MPFGDEELALIEAIHADPRDDMIRLVYSDWLEEHGEAEHAEFIRLQCQQPYVAISNRDPENPHRSRSFDFPYDDKTAKARLGRILEIFPVIYRSARYEAERKLPYHGEHYRGLPLSQIGNENYGPIADWETKGLGHLTRVDLSIRTENVSELLAHPIMARVDKLHIWPDTPWDAEPEFDGTMNSQYDRFWADHIPILADFPIIDHFVELNLCGCRSTGELTELSRKNIALSGRLLEPRVYVEYSY